MKYDWCGVPIGLLSKSCTSLTVSLGVPSLLKNFIVSWDDGYAGRGSNDSFYLVLLGATNDNARLLPFSPQCHELTVFSY